MSKLKLIIDNLSVEYLYAVERMESYVKNIHENGAEDFLWILEHDHLYTAGSSATDLDILDKNLLPIYQASRGGKYTYHGPGQRIAYVMMDLKRKFGEPDIRKYVFLLEEWIIQVLQELGVKGERREGRVGIWVVDNNGIIPKEEKIAAIGVRIKKWVTYHGISFNLNPDLSKFNGIVPCGLKDYGVTSLDKLKIEYNSDAFNKLLINKFVQVFEY